MSWFLWSTCQIYFFNKDLVIGLNNESQKKKKTNNKQGIQRGISNKCDNILNVLVKTLEKPIH